MYWDAKIVRPLPEYRLWVELENGSKGYFDMKPFLQQPQFTPLKKISIFNQVDIIFGAVTWQGEIDIAPETLMRRLEIINA